MREPIPKVEDDKFTRIHKEISLKIRNLIDEGKSPKLIFEILRETEIITFSEVNSVCKLYSNIKKPPEVKDGWRQM